MSAAVSAEPAAAEQKGIAAVRIEIDRRRRVVDLGIARRFANCSRTRLLNRTRIDSGGGGNRCCADRNSGSSRTQQRCQVTQFHSHGVTPWIVGGVCVPELPFVEAMSSLLTPIFRAASGNLGLPASMHLVATGFAQQTDTRRWRMRCLLT